MDRAASLFKDFNADYYTNFKKVIEDDNVELIYIVSNQLQKLNMQLKLIKKWKSIFVHIEKPHVVNENQLKIKLEKTLEFNNFRVNLGFNRPGDENLEKKFLMK